jgi:hypothetical protein
MIEIVEPPPDPPAELELPHPAMAIATSTTPSNALLCCLIGSLSSSDGGLQGVQDRRDARTCSALTSLLGFGGRRADR